MFSIRSTIIISTRHPDNLQCITKVSIKYVYYTFSKLMIFRSPYDLETVIVLEGSEYYEFIHGESKSEALSGPGSQ